MTSNNKSERKDWLTVYRGIIITVIGLFFMVTLKDTFIQCNGDDTFTSLLCDMLEASLIVFGATLGALLGFEVQRYENRKNKNCTQSG